MSTKKWRDANPQKNRAYVAKFLESNKTTTVILKPWMVEAIDKIKDPSQPYGGWIRKHLEEWLKEQGLTSTEANDSKTSE